MTTVNNTPLIRALRRGDYEPEGVNQEEKVMHFFRWAQRFYPNAAVDTRFVCYAVEKTQGLNRIPGTNNEWRVKPFQHTIKRLKTSRRWCPGGMPLVYSNKKSREYSGWRLCVDEDDKVQMDLKPRVRQIETSKQGLETSLKGMDVSKLIDESSIELLGKAQAVAHSLSTNELKIIENNLKLRLLK